MTVSWGKGSRKDCLLRSTVLSTNACSEGGSNECMMKKMKTDGLSPEKVLKNMGPVY